MAGEGNSVFKTVIASIAAIGTAAGAFITYLQYQARHEGPDIVIVSQPPAGGDVEQGRLPDKGHPPPIDAPPIEALPIQPPQPRSGYFGAAATDNYLALSAEPSIANSIRAALEIGSLVAETSPQFLDDGYFLKAIAGDQRWRTELEVPATAQKLYLIEVGPLMSDRQSRRDHMKSASRQLQIVVVDLAKSAVVLSKKLPITASQFSEAMLDADIEQQIGETLREYLSEIVKHEKT